MNSVPVTLNINQHDYQLLIAPHQSLLRVLRDSLGLTGTKENCSEARCGVCTALVDGAAVYACIYPAMRAVGKAVTTIEGLGSPGALHPMQQAFIDHNAVQCGYCIPGMIVSAVALINDHPDLTHDEIVHGLLGNLCRCTGYTKIVEAVRTAAQEARD